MKKILLLTYYFPPVGGVGVQRVSKLVKYLPESGFELVVVTSPYYKYYPNDLEILESDYIKHTKVLRPASTSLDGFLGRTKLGGKRNLSDYLLGLITLPRMDVYSAWASDIEEEVKRIVDQEGIKMIYSSAPPHSVHLLAKAVSESCGIPWVMELRDSMTEWPLRKPGVVSFLQKSFEKYYENRLYQSAAGIIFVTEYQRKHAIERCPYLLGANTLVVRNGFDAEEIVFTPIPPVERELRIVYTGSLKDFDLQVFCEGVNRFVQKNAGSADLCFQFVGSVDNKNRQLLERIPAEVRVEFTGIVSHELALKYQQSAHCLLLFQTADGSGRGGEILTGKVFEYIGSRRPILGVVVEGELSELISDNNLGVAAHCKNPDEICNAITRMYQLVEDWRDSAANTVDMKQFERRTQVAKIAKFLKNIS